MHENDKPLGTVRGSTIGNGRWGDAGDQGGGGLGGVDDNFNLHGSLCIDDGNRESTH